MIYFIPSWYNKKRIWYSTEQTWFRKQEVLDFDDTINQLRVFSESDENVKLIILNYNPNLRRFLHRENVNQTPYFSIFDELQGLEDDYVHPINYLDLEWPEDVSFHVNPFLIMVLKENDIYAKIYISRDGTLLSIEYYSQTKTHEVLYDDRGFVSSIAYFDYKGVEIKQEYYNASGYIVFTEEFLPYQIAVSPEFQHSFQSNMYTSMETLIQEKLVEYMQQYTSNKSYIVLALDQQHNQLVLHSLDKQKLVISFFEGRENARSDDLIRRADAFISDRELEYYEPISYQGLSIKTLPCVYMFSYYKRLLFGASAREYKLNIAFFVDNISQEKIEEGIRYTLPLLESNVRIDLLLCSFKERNLEYVNQLESLASKYNSKLRNLDLDEASHLEIELMGNSVFADRIYIKKMSHSSELIDTIAKARVFIDLGEKLNHHLCLECISDGVPQINKVENFYAEHKKTGYRIKDMTELKEALEFFLVGLKNWNESLIENAKRIAENEDQNILHHWKIVKERISHEDTPN